MRKAILLATMGWLAAIAGGVLSYFMMTHRPLMEPAPTGLCVSAFVLLVGGSFVCVIGMRERAIVDAKGAFQRERNRRGLIGHVVATVGIALMFAAVIHLRNTRLDSLPTVIALGGPGLLLLIAGCGEMFLDYRRIKEAAGKAS